jgi:hypothetical protein
MRLQTVTITIILLLTFSPFTSAKPFQSPDNTYSLTLPDDWTAIPADVLAATAQAARNPSAKVALSYDAGFQPAARKPWFSYPYCVVIVMPYSKFGLNRQIREDEFPKLVKAMTGLDINKAASESVAPEVRARLSNASLGQPILDTARRRFVAPIQLTFAGIGKVNGTMAGYFGRDALVQIGFYTLGQDAQRYAPTADAIIDSFHFAPAADYDPSANPPSFWSNVGRMTLTGAVIGGLVGLVGYLSARAKKSKSM